MTCPLQNVSLERITLLSAVTAAFKIEKGGLGPRILSRENAMGGPTSVFVLDVGRRAELCPQMSRFALMSLETVQQCETKQLSLYVYFTKVLGDAEANPPASPLCSSVNHNGCTFPTLGSLPSPLLSSPLAAAWPVARFQLPEAALVGRMFSPAVAGPASC